MRFTNSHLIPMLAILTGWASNARRDKNIVISYPTEDYKQYVYALGRHRVRRVYGSFETLGVGIEIRCHLA